MTREAARGTSCLWYPLMSREIHRGHKRTEILPGLPSFNWSIVANSSWNQQVNKKHRIDWLPIVLCWCILLMLNPVCCYNVLEHTATVYVTVFSAVWHFWHCYLYKYWCLCLCQMDVFQCMTMMMMMLLCSFNINKVGKSQYYYI